MARSAFEGGQRAGEHAAPGWWRDLRHGRSRGRSSSVSVSSIDGAGAALEPMQRDPGHHRCWRRSAHRVAPPASPSRRARRAGPRHRRRDAAPQATQRRGAASRRRPAISAPKWPRATPPAGPSPLRSAPRASDPGRDSARRSRRGPQATRVAPPREAPTRAPSNARSVERQHVGDATLGREVPAPALELGARVRRRGRTDLVQQHDDRPPHPAQHLQLGGEAVASRSGPRRH